MSWARGSVTGERETRSKFRRPFPLKKFCIAWTMVVLILKTWKILSLLHFSMYCFLVKALSPLPDCFSAA